MPVDQALVLVGGLGTRLRAEVPDRPKPLAPVAGRPFLAWVLDELARNEVGQVILATGFMSAMVEDAVGREWKGMAVHYSIEDQPLGTGGALRHALPLVVGDGLHVVNGDTFLRYSLRELEEVVRHVGTDVGVALAEVEDAGRYGAVVVRDGRVVRFSEKGVHGPGLVNAGCYFLTGKALSTLPALHAFSLEHEVLQPAAVQGRLAAFPNADGFIDIGIPEDFARAQHAFGKDSG